MSSQVQCFHQPGLRPDKDDFFFDLRDQEENPEEDRPGKSEERENLRATVRTRMKREENIDSRRATIRQEISSPS